MSLVLGEVYHRKPFLLVALILEIPSSTIIHETRGLLQSITRSLIWSEAPCEALYHNLEHSFRGPNPSPCTLNSKKAIKGDYYLTRIPPIDESP